MFQTARAAFAMVLIAMAPTLGAQAPAPAGARSSAARGDADLGYRSAFEGYQQFAEEQVGSWKAANDTVGRIGGWREYAKELRPPAAPAAVSDAASAGGPPGPHVHQALD